jgi:type VI secretion system protein ImpG
MEEPLKTLYERELNHLDGHAREFAERQKFRQIAARLGLGDAVAVHDPFVEWLLEGFAYLSARVQLKLDQEFPRFSQNLLAVVYPHLTAPTPSIIVAEFKPDHDDASLLDGPIVAKGVELRARASGAERKQVPFVTGRSLRLWPLEFTEIEYLSDRPAAITRSESTVNAAEVELRRRAELRVGDEGSRPTKVEAGLALRLKITQDVPLSSLTCDELDIFLPGRGRVPQALFEACLMASPRVEAVIRPQRRGEKIRTIPLEVVPLGFNRRRKGSGMPVEDDALFPYDLRSYDGARLLHEFFSLPERFQFMRLSGLARAFVAAGEAREIEIVFALSPPFAPLKGIGGTDTMKLHCVPAVNLFEMSADDLKPTLKKVEHHVIPDRANPADFEVHSILKVTGFPESGQPQEFRPFFSTSGFGARDDGSRRFYALNRTPREAPVTSRGDPQLKQYRGDEVYLSLVDEACAPYAADLRRHRGRKRDHHADRGGGSGVQVNPHRRRAVAAARRITRRAAALAHHQPSVAELSVADRHGKRRRGRRDASIAVTVRARGRPRDAAACGHGARDRIAAHLGPSARAARRGGAPAADRVRSRA